MVPPDKSDASHGATQAIPLEAVVEALREKLGGLIRATEERGRDLKFTVREVELEFSVGVTRSAQDRGQLNLWVGELGATEGWTTANTQTVKLRLEPEWLGRSAPQLGREE